MEWNWRAVAWVKLTTWFPVGYSDMQKKHAVWPWLLVVVAVAAAGWWLFKGRLPGANDTGDTAATKVAEPAALPPPVQTPDAAPAAQTPPPVQHPIDTDVAADASVPSKLADSDDAAWQELVKLVGGEQALNTVLRGRLISRVVTMVDNLTEQRVTQRSLALKETPGDLVLIDTADGGKAIGADNAKRYAPYVQAFTSVKASTLVAAYKRFYPLFQKAYVELGYPNRYFNDRLVQVVDHLLKAPEPQSELAVTRDDVGRWHFVDPELEQLSIGQKALVRLAPEQEKAVKQQLRAIREALTQP